MTTHKGKQTDCENKKMLCKMVFQQKKLIIALSVIVPIMAESTNFQVTVANDDGTGLTPETLSWAILQANENSGVDAITLTTDITVTGVMTRLIDSDVTIQSNQTKRLISGGNQFRPLFIKSGNVAIKNIDIQSGLAKGGGSSGAGLGGAIFIYSGQVSISHVTIGHSMAQGGNNSSRYGDGGGGMYGNGGFSGGGGGGGGMFASATGSQGGYGGWGNYQSGDNFGRGGGGGFSSSPGGFGGGGGGNSFYSNNASDGGFGGSGGDCYCYYSYSSAGDGGFGAGGGYPFYDGSYGSSGYGAAPRKGAGLGGAIFVRSGSLALAKVTITNNTAIATSGAKGLAGGIFVLHNTNNSNGNNQGMPDSLATVTACEVSFMNNQASSDPNTIDNNDDVFDLAGIINAQSGDPVSVICSDVIFENGFD